MPPPHQPTVDAERESPAQLAVALSSCERRYRMLAESSTDWITRLDPAGNCLYSSSVCQGLLGYPPEQLIGRSAYDLAHPHDVEAMRRAHRRVLGSGDTVTWTFRGRRSDGAHIWLETAARAVSDPTTGEVLEIHSSTRDVTARVEAQDALRDAEERFRRSFEDAPVGMAVVEAQLDGRASLREANPFLCQLTGYTKEALEATRLESLVHPDELDDTVSALRRLLRAQVHPLSHDTRLLRSDGRAVHVTLSASLIAAGDGFREVLVHVQDVTERRRFEGQLQYLADHDPLTGLFNRRRFDEELARELSAAHRYGTGGAVLVLDLDNFKYANDCFGHAVGDDLIARVGRLLRRRLRESDVLARLGGDEFAVILPHADAETACGVANDLLETIRAEGRPAAEEPMRRVTASIGIAPFFGQPTKVTSEELLVEADIAMYDAKEAGRDRVKVFDPSSQRQARMEARLTWGERIEHALTGDRFVLYAQRILGLHGDSRPRYELLIRMCGEQGDLIPPGTFLYVAERFDQIQRIDRWVVREAIRILAEHQRSGADPCFEVNLSAKSITDESLPDHIARELEATGADPRGLVFEVTETAAILNVGRAKQFADRLRELGCEFALDDFGAGFSSFYYLKHLAFDYLKIDGEFVKDLATSSTNQLVVNAVVDIARGLGKRTIAEFVSDRKTVELLRRYGVDYAQGYYVAEPAPVEALDPHVPAPVMRAPAEAG